MHPLFVFSFYSFCQLNCEQDTPVNGNLTNGSNIETTWGCQVKLLKNMENTMKDSNTRFHFINLVKVTKDFLGEHCSPLTESDCIALCSQQNVVDSMNKALTDAGLTGLKIQLNWSSDQGATWVQYPKSR